MEPRTAAKAPPKKIILLGTPAWSPTHQERHLLAKGRVERGELGKTGPKKDQGTEFREFGVYFWEGGMTR